MISVTRLSRRRLRRLPAWLILLAASLCLAQEPPGGQEVQQARQLWQQGRAQEAVRLLEKAVSEGTPSLDALHLLARIECERENWGNVRKWMKQALKLQPRNLDAYYYLGIAYRESGKYKAMLLRTIDWRKSRRYFENILARNPAFRDVFAQYAILQRYRQHYASAVELGERQLLYHPEAVDAEVDLHRSYDVLIENESAANAADWLARRPDDRARFFLAELLRRKEQFRQADSLYALLLDNPGRQMHAVPLYLALIRLRLAQNREQEAQDIYNQGIEAMQNEAEWRFLFEDMHYVLSDREYDYLQRLQTRDDIADFYRIIWIQRDPLPAAPVNVRLMDHFRRLIYAEKHFRYDGFRLEFNNPDKLHYLKFPKVFALNRKFNDKGLVHIRHGEPHERISTLDAEVQNNETWVYPGDGRQPKLIFHFVIDDNATGNNWRLTAKLTDKMVEDRLMIDPIFQRLYMADAMDRLRYEHDVAELSRETVAVGMNSDRHSWSRQTTPLEMPFFLAAFKGEGDNTRYHACIALRAGQIWQGGKGYRPERPLHMGMAVFDRRWKPLLSQKRHLEAGQIKSWSDSLGYFPAQFSFETADPTVYVSLFVRIPEEDKVGGYRFDLPVKRFAKDSTAISDVIIAESVRPALSADEFTWNGLRVMPNATRIFDKKEPVYVYFELYNLPADSSTTAHYTIQYRLKLLKKEPGNVFKQITGLFSRQQEETSNLVERFSSKPFSAEYLALDLNKKMAGHYELEVIAALKESGLRLRNKTGFALK